MLPSQDLWNNGFSDGETVTLSNQWDDVLARICGGKDAWWEGQEYLFRRMMREEAIATADRIFRSLVCEGEHGIRGNQEEPKPGATRAEKALFKLSEEALAFTRAWVDGLPKDYDLKALAWDLLESVAFGHKLAEIEYGQLSVDEKPFKGATYVAPVDLSPKPRTVYDFRVTKANRIVGVIPRGGKDDAVIPAANIVVMTSGGMDRDPRGNPILATIWDRYESKARSRKNQGKSGDQIGGGFLWVTQQFPPESANVDWYVDVPDGTEADGVTPKTKKVSRTRIAAVEAAKLSTGKVGVGAPGQDLKLIQSTGADVFAAFIDYDDRCIFRAFLGSAQIALEAKRDSQAASGKAENVGETIRDAARGLLGRVIETLFATVLELNHGAKYKKVTPRYDIVTEESSDFAVIVTAMLNPQFPTLPVDVQNYIADKGGFPAVFEEQEEVLPTDGQDPEQIDAEDQKASKEEVAAFVAGFLPRG